MAWKFTDPKQLEAAIILPLALLPADRLFPLRQGAEIFRVMKAARQSHDPSFPIQEEEPKFTFEIGFSDGVVMTGEPVEEKLEEIYTRIEKILLLANQQFSISNI
jgi:hypothetical protein